MNKSKQLLYDLFQAYYDARRNKRNTLNQLEFEYNLEENIIKLYDELISGKYSVGRSICFIQTHPVKREIFAGDFRDRIIHHLVYNYLYPILDRSFIYDSYSCRVGKGTHFGVKRLQKFIKSCSGNNTQDCYILKLDISGYFMNMNKHILFSEIKNIISKKKGELTVEYNFLLEIISKIVFHDCTKDSIFKGKKSNYIGLPKNKSLFFSKVDCGLPIGNLTSQLFSNIYMDCFDKFVKKDLKCKYYGRYVDDFFVVNSNKKFLLSIIPKMSEYLQNNLGLDIHPKKIYLQHYSRGVQFLGVIIKPHRTYIRKRTFGYFYEKILLLNKRLYENDNELNKELQSDFISTLNSYLGMLKHHKSYKKRKQILLEKVSAYFWNYFYISHSYTVIKKKKSTS